MDHNKNNIASSRVSAWKTALDAELQALVQEASEIRKQITNAKTSTKKQYYEKKFVKVRSNVMTALAALERVRQMTSQETEHSIEGDGDATNDQPTTA